MVEFIEYKKKKYPIRISYYVLLMAQKEAGVDIDELEKNFEAQQLILWYALKAGHKLADQELTLDKEEMVWVLDACYLDFQKAMYGFAKSLIDIQQEAFSQQEKKGEVKKK